MMQEVGTIDVSKSKLSFEYLLIFRDFQKIEGTLVEGELNTILNTSGDGVLLLSLNCNDFTVFGKFEPRMLHHSKSLKFQ